MAAIQCTFRCYRTTPNPTLGTDVAVQVGGSLTLTVPNNGVVPAAMLIFVDPNPTNGGSYVITGTSNGAATAVAMSSNIMLLSVGS